MSVPTFPTLPGLTFPLDREMAASSVRQEAISGKRVILPLRTVLRWTWTLPFEFLRSAAYGDNSYSEIETLLGFVASSLINGTVFGYQDAEDNAVTDQPFGQGDDATLNFQLVRSRGGFTEPVYLPTVTSMTVAGSPVIEGTDFTVGNTGIVTFNSAPANGAALQWTGTFLWMCRFDADTLKASRFMLGLHEVKALTFSNEISP